MPGESRPRDRVVLLQHYEERVKRLEAVRGWTWRAGGLVGRGGEAPPPERNSGTGGVTWQKMVGGVKKATTAEHKWGATYEALRCYLSHNGGRYPEVRGLGWSELDLIDGLGFTPRSRTILVHPAVLRFQCTLIYVSLCRMNLEYVQPRIAIYRTRNKIDRPQYAKGLWMSSDEHARYVSRVPH